MSISFKKIIRQRDNKNTGYGRISNGRFINPDGSSNVEHKGINILNKFSWYHTMLNLSATRFICYLFMVYIFINLFFAFIYYLIGVEHLTGIDKSNPINEFIDVFFFSSQTFTTVGYGRISPVGFFASLMATLEAFLGLLAFAIATGLFYGRFSRPRAFLKFSKNILVAPFQGGKALMFRIAPYKNNSLTDAEVTISTAIEVQENGETRNKFFPLEPDTQHINALSLNWTIVHKIDENSPFAQFTENDFENVSFEIIIQIRAFDEVFSNTVVQRTSYITKDLIYGAKFSPMYYPSKDSKTTILDLQKTDHFFSTEIAE